MRDDDEGATHLRRFWTISTSGAGSAGKSFWSVIKLEIAVSWLSCKFCFLVVGISFFLYYTAVRLLCCFALEVWPESHWPGFALRQTDVL